MNEAYTFLTTAEWKTIKSMKVIIERIIHQTLECSYFIQTYCMDPGFRKLT